MAERALEWPDPHALPRLAMSYQSILVHVDDSERVVVRLGAAARLARSFDAELIGAYSVATPVVTPSMSAMMPNSVVHHRVQEMGDAQNAAEALFRAAAARARVGAAEWRAPAGDPIPALLEHARCTDLVVLGQRDPDDTSADFGADLANGVLLQSGRPDDAARGRVADSIQAAIADNAVLS